MSTPSPSGGREVRGAAADQDRYVEGQPVGRSTIAWRFVMGLFLGLLAVVGTACGSGEKVPTPRPTPSEQELQALTRTVVTAFAEAVKKEDFTEFFKLYPIGSTANIGPGMLKTSYQHFIDDKIDVSGAASVDAVYDGPPTSESLVILMVEGHYPLPAGKVPFMIRFRYEDERWQLHKFHIRVPE